MKNSFVPSYIIAEKSGRQYHHFSQVLRGAIAIGFFLSLMGLVLSPVLLPVFYPQFDPEIIRLTVHVSIIFFISVFFVAMNSVYEAYLDAESKYSISVFSQIIVLLCSITGGVFFSDLVGVSAFAYGYLFGVIVSFLIKKLVFIPAASHSLIGKLDKHELKPFIYVFIPVAITVMVGQVNLFIDNIFASKFSAQAVSYLNYSKNIVHFPQAIIGVTIGTIIFPILSKAIADSRIDAFRKGVEKGLVLTAFLLLPAVAGMMWLMTDIIEVVYERGAFTHEATLATSLVGFFYVGSVVFFSLQNTINKAFYAKQNGKVILKISLFSILLNIALNFLFIRMIGSYIAIPLASSVMAAVYFTLNIIVYQRMEGNLNWRYILLNLAKITLSISAMVTFLWVLDTTINFSGPIPKLIVEVLLGSLVYAIVSIVLKIDSIHEILTRFLKRRG